MSTLIPSFASWLLSTIAVEFPATSFATSIRKMLKPFGYFDFARYDFAFARSYAGGFRAAFQYCIL